MLLRIELGCDELNEVEFEGNEWKCQRSKALGIVIRVAAEELTTSH